MELLVTLIEIVAVIVYTFAFLYMAHELIVTVLSH